MSAVNPIRFGTVARSIAMTCAADGRSHLVSDLAVTAGLAAGHGIYAAACGHVVVSSSMLTPPGPPCRDCETALHRIATTGPVRSRRRYRDVVAWLLGWRIRRSRPATTARTGQGAR